MEALKDLLVDQLRDLFSAEGQLVKALPKMAKAAESEELKDALNQHLAQTKTHVERLQRCFEILDAKAKRKVCRGMEGLLEEGAEAIEERSDEENILDLAIIAAAQRVEHYEIAAYGTVRTMAEQVEEDEIVELLSQTLEEEEAADEVLTELAQPLYEQLREEAGEAEVEEEEETEEEEQPKPRRLRRAS